MWNPKSDNVRRFERRLCSKAIACSVGVLDPHEKKTLNLKARAVDISDGGIGIEADYPLAPGHTLWFQDIENKSGVVRWYAKLNEGYRIGIQMTLPKTVVYSKTESPNGALPVAEEKDEYTAALDQATDRFNRELEAIEKRCDNPGESGEKILAAVSDVFDGALSVCGEVERGLQGKDMIRRARIRFHERTAANLSRSYCISRTRTWPQGCQGDYKTLEAAYRNMPLSQGIGYYLDLYMLNTPLAVGVRNRIKKLSEMLRGELGARQQPSVLNIGCGSCRELMDVAPEIVASNAQITCIDNDNDALAFAQDRLSYAGVIDQVELRKYNALRMFDDEMNLMEFGHQDIIYSAGLFDYLPDDFLAKLLRALFNLLNTGGKLIAAFKDASRYRSLEYHWIADWDGFLQRAETDFLRILRQSGIPDDSLSMTREETGVILFYTASK